MLLGDADWLRKRLKPSDRVAGSGRAGVRLAAPQLIPTLSLNSEETRQARDEAERRVPTKSYTTFEPGDLIVTAGEPLTDESMDVLRAGAPGPGHSLSFGQRLCYSLATLGMFVALSTLCGVYVLCYERKLIDSMRQFSIFLAWSSSPSAWRCWPRATTCGPN